MFLHLTFHQQDKDKVQVDHALIMWNIILEGNINKLKWRHNSSNKDNWTCFAFALDMNVYVVRYKNVPKLGYGRVSQI
jgi:hypothetical protein